VVLWIGVSNLDRGYVVRSTQAAAGAATRRPVLPRVSGFGAAPPGLAGGIENLPKWPPRCSCRSRSLLRCCLILIISFAPASIRPGKLPWPSACLSRQILLAGSWPVSLPASSDRENLCVTFHEISNACRGRSRLGRQPCIALSCLHVGAPTTAFHAGHAQLLLR
jgi:hypothetical protein